MSSQNGWSLKITGMWALQIWSLLSPRAPPYRVGVGYDRQYFSSGLMYVIYNFAKFGSTATISFMVEFSVDKFACFSTPSNRPSNGA